MRTAVSLTTLILVAASSPVHAQAMPTVPAWRPALASLYRDSFDILVDGQTQGTHTFELAVDGKAFRYSESVTLAGLGTRNLQVKLDPTLRPLHSHSDGRILGQPTGVDLTYRGTHVTGQAWVQRGKEPARQVAVDRELSPHAIDGLALMCLLLTLDWQPGVLYDITLFDPDENRETVQRLRISGPEQVAVPAGIFSAYRADLTTTQAPVRIWVTTRKPHRLVKIGGQTESFATVLVGDDPRIPR